MGNQASIEKAYGLVSKLQDVLVFKNKLGSPTIPMRYVINVQKGGTLFYCLYLMYKFNNFSHTACTYMALHGTYGFLWLLKDQIFPDAGWEQKITVFASIVSAVAVLGP